MPFPSEAVQHSTAGTDQFAYPFVEPRPVRRAHVPATVNCTAESARVPTAPQGPCSLFFCAEPEVGLAGLHFPHRTLPHFLFHQTLPRAALLLV